MLLTRMFSLRPGTPGRRQQMPRTTRSICTPAFEAAIEPVDQPGIDQRVELGPDRGRLAGAGVGDLGVDQAVERGPQRHRREGDLLHLLGPGVAGHVVEQARGIAAHRRIAGEERQVGVDARRDRMVVAGAEMHVGADRLRLAAHHHRDLGVGLELDEAVDHLHAGALEVARPADVGLLVEARLELDQRRHRSCRPRPPRSAP